MTSERVGAGGKLAGFLADDSGEVSPSWVILATMVAGLALGASIFVGEGATLQAAGIGQRMGEPIEVKTGHGQGPGRPDYSAHPGGAEATRAAAARAAASSGAPPRSDASTESPVSGSSYPSTADAGADGAEGPASGTGSKDTAVADGTAGGNAPAGGGDSDGGASQGASSPPATGRPGGGGSTNCGLGNGNASATGNANASSTAHANAGNC
jgi:hypothetical protein